MSGERWGQGTVGRQYALRQHLPGDQFLVDGVIERPAEIEFRDELPKTMIGKLSKKELVSEHRQQQEERTS